jgi:tRNA-dihydrouridine synthase B
MKIGPYQLNNNLLLAPMAGITDLPFRQLCRYHGAAMAFSEMVSSKPDLRKNHRTLLKARQEGEIEPRAIQLLGTNPQQLADAARYNAEQGAQIIDINMGCPAKKVCNVAAGSALLRNEELVENILTAVVNAVDIPVTLKIRTGWDKQNINALSIAKIAEACGIQALTIHGRTRRCGFTGEAEHSTIREVKKAVSLPVIANGDIQSPEQAKQVLQFTGADAIMIGRGAQGDPWIFREIEYFLDKGTHRDKPDCAEFSETILKHLSAIHQFYGDYLGLRVARKHIGWYFKKTQNNQLTTTLRDINRITESDIQIKAVRTALEYYKNSPLAA